MKTTLLALLFCIVFCASAFSQKAEKIHEFENPNCDYYLAIVDNAIVQARNNPSSTVYVLIYEGKETKYNKRKKKTELVFPTVGSAKAKILSVKNYLFNRGFPTERFSFVEAGFRENLMVEIWLVPEGAKPPESTPTLTEMKYRKGKAVGFCTWCCG